MTVDQSRTPAPETPAYGAALTVQVVAPDGVLWSGPARGVTVPSTSGSLGILARHSPVATVLGAGTVRVRLAGGEAVEVAITGGFVVADDDEVTVLVDAVVPAED